MIKDGKAEERRLRMYPDKGLVTPKGEFVSSLAEVVRLNFPKLQGR